MAKAKKQEKSIEQRLEEALVLYEKTPYEVPSNWCWTKLPYITQIKTGKRDANHAKEDGQYRFYTCSAEYSMADTYAFEGESIIVPGNGDIGLVFYYDGKFEAYQRTYVINGFKGQTKYLYYYFYYKWREKNTYKQFGTAIPYVRMANFEEFEIPLAPLEEQKRIVESIEKQFAKLDEARDLIQKSLDSFADRKSAILHKAFTGELTKNWRESNSRKESKQRISIEEVVEINPKNKKPICDDESEVSFVPMRAVCEIKGEVKEILFEKFKKVKKGFTYFEEDDVLFAKITPCMENGKCFVASVLKNGFGFASTEFYVFRCSNKINKKYLWYILRDKSFRNKAAQVMTGAVGQQRVPKSFLEKEKIYLYDMEEQEEIVRILDSIFEKEDKSKELLDMLDKIDEMKKSILARAFRGQLGTSNPTDEPATDLLRKILAQSN